MANEIVGSTRNLVLADEADWGVTPSPPAYAFLPVTEYGVRFKPQSRQAALFLGLFQRKHSRRFRGLPQGTLTAPFFGWRSAGYGLSQAEYLLRWAFDNPNAAVLPSKLAEWAEGPNVANKRHNGLRVDTATLSGSAESGTVDISLSLIGKSEAGQDVVTTAQTLPSNRHRAVSADFSDCTFQLGGVTIPLKAFQVKLQNGLKAEYLNSFTPSLLLRTQRALTVQMTVIKNGDVYDALNRASTDGELTGRIVIKGLSNGTGSTGMNWTVATLDFPRLALQLVENQGGATDIVSQPLNFVALKPDDTRDDVVFTWSESA